MCETHAEIWGGAAVVFQRVSLCFLTLVALTSCGAKGQLKTCQKDGGIISNNILRCKKLDFCCIKRDCLSIAF